MKTTTTYKVQQLQRAIKDGQKPEIMLRGSDLIYRIDSMRSLHHSIEVTVSHGQGVLIIDPDDIMIAKFVSLPARGED